jgi:DedD protein
MGLLDIFTKRDSAGAKPALSAAASVMTGEQAEQARVRARRRLIGAVVLLGIGVIAFPLLFETQPRPIAVDIPIVIPPRDGAPPLALPAPRPAAKPAASAPVAAPSTTPTTASAAPLPSTVTAKPVEAPQPAPVRASEPVAPPKPVVAAASSPPPAPKPAAETPKPVAQAAGRFVVQIGAFAEASAVRDVRSKAEKAGLATFTQTVSTADGQRTRVRLGPFASREEAEKAAAQAKAAGLGGAVLTL